jgi:hypothetical protein
MLCFFSDVLFNVLFYAFIINIIIFLMVIFAFSGFYEVWSCCDDDISHTPMQCGH